MKVKMWQMQLPVLLCLTAPLLVAGQVEQDIEDLTDSLQTAPCSCDCCQVAERLPVEQVGLADGTLMDRKCARPDTTNPDMCPAQCQATAHDVLFAAKESTDYDRYCFYKCKPTMATIGTACTRLDIEDRTESTSDSGNGKQLLDGVSSMNSPESDWGAAISEGARERALAVEASQEASERAAAGQAAHNKITFDMRKLVANRLRSEAGASMSHLAAGGERVRVNQHSSLRAGQLAKEVQRAIAPEKATLEESVLAVQSSVSMAGEEEKKADKAVKEAEIVMESIGADARKLAEEKIKEAIKPDAEREAKAFATLAGYDKPEGYEKIVAAKSSDPYMQAMTMAVTRMSEYEAYAHSLLGQARGAQIEAEKEAPQANAMEAHGDKIGAAQEWTHIHALLAKSKSLESQAKDAWNTANNARKSVPEWQDGGAKAAAYSAWEWKAYHTPPPAF